MAFLTYDEFLRHLKQVRARVVAACAAAGRSPDSVRILAVTKTHPVEVALYAHRAGLAGAGENRVQEALEKIAMCPDPSVRWELIGHLQSNKAVKAAAAFARIQSVDRAELAQKLDRAAAAIGKVLPVLLQVNAGDDPAKFGVTCADAPALLEIALQCPALKIEGLMTVAPLAPENPAIAQKCFARLRGTRDTLAKEFGLPLAELSMGMSDDLESAIREGSTLVRVGSALFGKRE
ncbi:MAG TPA: YggS family pyridoxal phosphate-dependent enzyme [Opitutales bacterium]|jgi:pyridoxal phosphate enzyme (YggS family)|nr:YggS family pyridoxal phosphate-dependent enzyme [Opitutales bacterium]